MQCLRYRESRFLTKRQVSACCKAARFSEEVGFPLNLQVTVDFRHTEVAVVSHAFEKLRSGHFTRWFARKKLGFPAYYIWTIEAAGNGAHVNWLIHMPYRIVEEFKKKIEKWFLRIVREENIRPTDLHFQEIGTLSETGNGLMGLVRYVCKGINPSDSNRMFIRHVDQGCVVGKRSGVSRTLGKAAIQRRREAGFAKPSRRLQPRTRTAPTYFDFNAT